MKNQQEDSVLVKEYMNGNEKALEVLINRYNQTVSSFIYSKVHDRDISQDIFQDTFIRVIRTLRKGTYKEEGKFSSWVLKIAHNIIMDYFRREAKMNKYERTDEFDIFEVIGGSSQSIENEIVLDDMAKGLQDLIKELPEKQSEVLIMRIYMEMSFKEIATTQNTNINTVLGRMRYALINLRKIIEENKIALLD